MSFRRDAVYRSPLAVAAVAFFGYCLIFIAFLNHLGDLRDFILISESYVNQSHVSSAISADPTYRYSPTGGYDGQFAYFIALDPINARYYMDSDSYRYTRVLYPMLARSLALADPGRVPLSLVLVNLLAITAGTWAVASWCRRHNLSVWLALVYSFYVGQVIVFTRDLTEAVAYALVAIAVYMFDRWHQGWGLVSAGLLFGLSALARETTLAFGLLYGIFLFKDNPAVASGERARRATGFLLLALGPALLWQCFLWLWLDKPGLAQGAQLLRVPFSSIDALYPLSAEKLDVVQVVVVPGIICLFVALLAIWREPKARARVELWALAANCILYVALLPPESILELFAASRIALGVVLGAIYSLPYLSRRGWFYACSGVWMAATVAFLLNPLLQLFHAGSGY